MPIALPAQLDEPLVHRGLVIVPLFPRRDLTIRETSETGSVPELLVENPRRSACCSTTARSWSAPSRTGSST